MKKFNLIIIYSIVLVGMKNVYGQTTEMVIKKEVSAYEGVSYKAVKSVTLLPGFEFAATSGSSFSITIAPDNTPSLNVQTDNRIVTEEIKIPGITSDSQVNSLTNAQKQTTVSYWDGLQRSIQVIDLQGSPTGKDMVQPMVYDAYGRQGRQYLPYASSNTSGNYIPGALTEQAAFYNTGTTVAADAQPYAQTQYDQSPLDQVIEQGAAGADWQPGTNHTVKNAYRVNTTADAVINWTAAGPGSNYSEQELLVSEVTDEHGNKTLTFSDKSGKMLLKRVHLDEDVTEGGSTVHEDYLETYYVYDDLGNLVYQVSPKAVSKLKNGATWNSSFINEWVFSYSYDEHKRLIEKKTPGSGAIYVVYDQLDRPVMTQDAKNRSIGKWFFTKYDLQSRPVQQGIYTYSELYSGSPLTPREQLQKYYNELNYDSGAYYYEKRQASTTHGYSNQVFPTSITSVLTVNYYDDYDFDYNASPDYSYISSGLSGAAAEAHPFIQGQLTGSKKLVVGTSTWLTNVIFYDQYGRAIQKRSNNLLYNTGLDDLQALVYTGFAAAPTLAKQIKKTSSSVSITVNNRYEYDHRERLQQVYQAINGSGEQLVAQYAYNELGQLIDKSLHEKSGGGFLQSADYRYNIRGWLTRINNSSLSTEADDNGVSDIFGMEMTYNTTVSGLTSIGDVRFDGRLSAVKWKTNDIYSGSSTPIYERSYRFAYDKTGRLNDAIYAANNGANWTSEAGGYDERDISYDQNGNLLGLKRYYIANGSSTAAQIDDLTYTYASGAGNRLTQVEDASASSMGFKESVHISGEYEYDDNGNLVTDKNKGDGTTAVSMTYNDLNKISRADFPGGKYIQYTYAATGERLKKESYDGSTLKTTDYIEGFVYENTTLAYFPMAEGRVRNAGGTLKYEYYLTDHQGNVRVSFEDNGSGVAKIVQENHYYPFGLAMKGAVIRTALPGSPNKNLYNGLSELQDDFGDDPNVYSTFFREYDPVLGRMNAIDPMADKYGSYSPYNYAFSDPVNLNDPTGGDPYEDARNNFGDRYYRNNWLTAGEQWMIEGLEENGDVYTGGDPWSGASYVNSFTGERGVATGADRYAHGMSMEQIVRNWQFDQDPANATRVMLPEVSISAFRNGSLPSWWGQSDLFLNGGTGANTGGGIVDWFNENKGKLKDTGVELLNGAAGAGEITGGAALISTPTGVGQVAGGYMVADGAARIATSAVRIVGIWSGNQSAKNTPHNILGLASLAITSNKTNQNLFELGGDFITARQGIIKLANGGFTGAKGYWDATMAGYKVFSPYNGAYNKFGK